MSSVTPNGKVRSAYDDFLEAFRTAVESANQNISNPQRPLASSFVASGNQDEVAFVWSFYLKGWPSRPLPRGKRLDIVVKAMETFATPDWNLTKSTVYVNYFVVSGSSIELAQSLHYDFDASVPAGHPLFHVQLTHEMIPESDLRSVGFAETVSQTDRQCWVTTRIPTPDMTLASVVYCLVADHLEASHFAEFAKRVASLEGRIPSPNFDPIRKSLAATTGHFKSSHWYSHMASVKQPG